MVNIGMKTFNLFFICVFSGICLTGCGSINASIHIRDMDKCNNVPKYKIPVKFCIVNNKKISDHCIKNYPDLFTGDTGQAVKMSVYLPESPLERIYMPMNGTFFLSLLSLGIIPAVGNKEEKCNFEIKLHLDTFGKTEQKFVKVTRGTANIGIVGLLLPTCQLFSSRNAVFSGRSWGLGEQGFWYVDENFNEECLPVFCKVILHLLSTIPSEKIVNHYISNIAPPVELLK